MTAKPFNSLAGFSAGIPAVQVVDANGNVVTNVLTTGNVTANIVYAGSYKFANGNPLTLPAGGSNTQLQFNNAGSISGIPNVTWNGNVLSLGQISNVSISGGENGYFLQTDGNGVLTWATGGGGGGNGSPGGSNSQIQFNFNGAFGASPNLEFNSTTNTLVVPTVSANLVGTASNANTAITVTANAQPNITSVGNLTALSVSGNLNISNIANLHIPGGNAGYFIQTDGNGNLLWSAAGGGGNGAPGGINTEIQYNKSGSFAGSPYFTFNDVTNTLQVAGPLIANSYQLGAGIYEYSNTIISTSGTASTSPSQPIYIAPAANVLGVDFNIIATTPTLGIINKFNISSSIIGSNVNYVEYGGVYSNGSVGDFQVVYNSGNIISPAAIELVVTPSSSQSTVYKMTVTTYSA